MYRTRWPISFDPDRLETPTDEEYGDMLIKESRPEDDDEEAVDKYDVGTDGERCGVVKKRSHGD